jgi:hypothetical protein
MSQYLASGGDDGTLVIWSDHGENNWIKVKLARACRNEHGALGPYQFLPVDCREVCPGMHHTLSSVSVRTDGRSASRQRVTSKMVWARLDLALGRRPMYTCTTWNLMLHFLNCCSSRTRLPGHGRPSRRQRQDGPRGQHHRAGLQPHRR